MPFLGGFSAILVHATSTYVVPQNITKSLATESVTIAESSHVRLVAKTRTRTEIVIVSEAIARIKTIIRTLAAETTSIAEAIVRERGRVRLLSAETIIISDSIARLIAKIRETGYSHFTSETLGNLISKIRALAAQTITISDAVDKVLGVTGIAIEKTLSESELISEASGRLKAVWRLQPP